MNKIFKIITLIFFLVFSDIFLQDILTFICGKLSYKSKIELEDFLIIDIISVIFNAAKIPSPVFEKSDKIISSGYFKNNAQLLNTLQSQKNIADNRNKYLFNEKKNIQQKIIINNLKKNKAEDKTSEYKKQYRDELEKRNSL